jgi:hypothetical protein
MFLFFFYFGALCALVHDIMTIQSPKETKVLMENLEKEEKTKDTILQGCFLLFLSLFYLAWEVLVLFTNSWPLILILFGLSFIPKKNKPIWFLKLDAWVSVILIILIVLNQAHFKIHLF